MTVYYRLESSDIKKVLLQEIHLKSRDGNKLILSSDETECTNEVINEVNVSDGRLKGVYINDEYGNGRVEELLGSEIVNAVITGDFENANKRTIRFTELQIADSDKTIEFADNAISKEIEIY